MSAPTWDEQVTSHVSNYDEEPVSAARGYLELVNHLNFYRGRDVVSFEILAVVPKPEDGTPRILIDGPAIAIGKKELVKAFVYARNVFFGHHLADAYARKAAAQTHSLERTNAAEVMLLFDPEHLTASNYLKKHTRQRVQKDLEGSVVNDLWFLESVLTSPLRKHSKSPTLWYHRFWLVKICTPWESPNLEMMTSGSTGAQSQRHTAYKRAQFWHAEYKVAMNAADQHEKNFYAFQYLRRLWVLLWPTADIWTHHLRADTVGSETLLRLSKWCRKNARDISGWTFFIWLCCQPQATHNMKIFAQRQIGAIEAFKERLKWQGASVEYFLKSMKDLGPVHFPDGPICVLRSGEREVRSLPGDRNSADTGDQVEAEAEADVNVPAAVSDIE